MVLSPISAPDYVQLVLPETFRLWGNGRSFERYAADFAAVAKSAYARRRPFTLGLRAGDGIVSSLKRYDREIRWGKKRLRAAGVGAVFTPPGSRGLGYASAMLGALLDAERAAGRDLVYLFSDIRPAFYEDLGFVRLASRSWSVRSTSLDGSAIGSVPIGRSDWAGVRRCFDALDERRTWSLRRTPLVWEWMRLKWEAPGDTPTQPVHLAIRDGRSVAAYVVGLRAPAKDTFIVDDFAFAGDRESKLMGALLRTAAGDLGRVGGWLPPTLARSALPRGYVKSRKTAIFMVMPLTSLARSWLATMRAELEDSDPVWSADHV